MADDTKPPVTEKSPEVLAGIEKRKRNLMPPLKPGQVLNREGKNGRDKNKVVVDFLEAQDSKDPEKRARIQVLLDSMYLRARLGHSAAMKYLAEQYTGKAKQQVELSNPDGTLSPLGPDSVADALRAAIEERRRAKEVAPQEQPADDGAGKK
jgi:hypothetical protein